MNKLIIMKNYDDLDGKKGNNPVISARNEVVKLINQHKIWSD